MDEQGKHVWLDADADFLDTLTAGLDEGIVTYITTEERRHLFRLAREVGISWVDAWFPEEGGS